MKVLQAIPENCRHSWLKSNTMSSVRFWMYVHVRSTNNAITTDQILSNWAGDVHEFLTEFVQIGKHVLCCERPLLKCCDAWGRPPVLCTRVFSTPLGHSSKVLPSLSLRLKVSEPFCWSWCIPRELTDWRITCRLWSPPYASSSSPFPKSWNIQGGNVCCLSCSSHSRITQLNVGDCKLHFKHLFPFRLCSKGIYYIHVLSFMGQGPWRADG